MSQSKKSSPQPPPPPAPPAPPPPPTITPPISIVEPVPVAGNPRPTETQLFKTKLKPLKKARGAGMSDSSQLGIGGLAEMARKILLGQ